MRQWLKNNCLWLYAVALILSVDFAPERVFDSVRQLSYTTRDQIEFDSNYVQLIPVALVTDTSVQKVVVAKKLKTATSQDSPERRKDLIYFGGHIREEDEANRVGGDSVSAVASAALSRELKEELDIDYVSSEPPKFCIWDRTNARSANHIAIVYHVKINRPSLRVVGDRKEFAERGADIVDRTQLASRSRHFERWSTEIFERLLS